MNIEICSHATLQGLLATQPGGYDLLLVTNPGYDPPADALPLARRVLHLVFDDHHVPRPGRRLPAAEDVRRALEWSADSTDLVVSCNAGVSRSSALAYIILCRQRPPQEAIAALTPNWHRPNELIVRLGAQLL